MRGMHWLAPALAGSFVFVRASAAVTLQEDFSTDPTAQGWRVFGDTNLFSWDSVQKQLLVTWDSSKSNSYFYHSLGTVLTRDDDFSMAFDLRLSDILPGANPNKSGAFDLAIGLFNLQQATNSAFLRGTGKDSPNLVEFDYFPDAGFGATIWPIFISTNSAYNYNSTNDYTLLALQTGASYHVLMVYAASNSTLTTTMTQNGMAFGPVHSDTIATNFTDFRVNTFAVSSYSDTGDDFDSILAHGTVDNLVITTPPPPLSLVTGGFASSNTWQVGFTGRTNWIYTLEASTDLQSWINVSVPLTGTGSSQTLQDAATTSTARFYRVCAKRP